MSATQSTPTVVQVSADIPRPGLVSVIVPVYNAGRYLAECIESIIAQTYRNLEIIAIDDGSSDDSSEILGRWANQIRFVTQTNRGVSSARNLGILLSHGEFLVFFDADDRMHPTLVEALATHLQSNPGCDMVRSDVGIIDSKGEALSTSACVPFGPNPYRALLCSPCMAIQGIMLRRTLLARVGLFTTDLEIAANEDWDLWLRCAREAASIDYVPKIVADYRTHESNATRNYTRTFKNGVRMLHRHRPSGLWTSDRTAWRKGIRQLHRGWIWSLMKDPELSFLARSVAFFRMSVQYPLLSLIFPEVATKKIGKLILRTLAPAAQAKP